MTFIISVGAGTDCVGDLSSGSIIGFWCVLVCLQFYLFISFPVLKTDKKVAHQLQQESPWHPWCGCFLVVLRRTTQSQFAKCVPQKSWEEGNRPKVFIKLILPSGHMNYYVYVFCERQHYRIMCWNSGVYSYHDRPMTALLSGSTSLKLKNNNLMY